MPGNGARFVRGGANNTQLLHRVYIAFQFVQTPCGKTLCSQRCKHPLSCMRQSPAKSLTQWFKEVSRATGNTTSSISPHSWQSPQLAISYLEKSIWSVLAVKSRRRLLCPPAACRMLQVLRHLLPAVAHVFRTAIQE